MASSLDALGLDEEVLRDVDIEDIGAGFVKEAGG